MNGNSSPEDRGWIEATNSIVRSIVTLLFGVSVCYGFLFSRINNVTLVSPDAFSTIAMAVILWWFKDRGDKEKAKETAALVAAVTPTTTEPKMEKTP
jgi:hypothetical protein